MARTQIPDTVKVDGRTFKTNALPDPFDGQDLIYRPRLQVLVRTIDQRAGLPILDQIGNACTGHAVAALIDTVLAEEPRTRPKSGAPRVPLTQVSPYMLYALARRYDEFPGTEDVGSSLRGAFKGWHRHGVCKASSWGPRSKGKDLTDPAFMRECADVPLGAYYRVNIARIDDMQSAITELNAIAVSAAIHEGWRTPKTYAKAGGKPIYLIDRSGDSAPMGGHAFVIAGYNDVGFLVQNSWGTTWGHKGYATLPYEDWLDNAYDAWVARPGVPQTLFARPRQWTVSVGDTVVGTVGPDLTRLPRFVVDVEAGGLPSPGGKAQSSPRQIADLGSAMATQLDRWATDTGNQTRNVVLYAHGGLVEEDGGIRIADRMISWWLANKVYPVHIVWESGAPATIISYLKNRLLDFIPFGGFFDGLWEQVDRRIEGEGRHLGPLWEEMKMNARAASNAIRNPDMIDWTRRDPGPDPGVSLLIEQLRKYSQAHPGQLKVHLVGHSAGSVVLASALRRLVTRGLTVESMQLMGGAIPVTEFIDQVVPALSSGRLRRFATFDLTDSAELDDTCPGPPVTLYHKSLLYLVARSLELDGPANPTRAMEVPMMGLSKYLQTSFKLPDGSSKRLVDIIGGPGNTVIGPNHETAPINRSAAAGHGWFDDDPDTLTAVLLRMLGLTDLASVQPYPRGGMPTSGGSVGSPTVVAATTPVGEEPTRLDQAVVMTAARDLAKPIVTGASPGPVIVGDPYGRALAASGYAPVAGAVAAVEPKAAVPKVAAPKAVPKAARRSKKASKKKG